MAAVLGVPIRFGGWEYDSVAPGIHLLVVHLGTDAHRIPISESLVERISHDIPEAKLQAFDELVRRLQKFRGGSEG
jgi:hypothetical protein